VLPEKGGILLRSQLRSRSKRLFGNADRLEVAVAVATSHGMVHSQELANQLSISPPRVRSQLLAFVEAGLMEALPRDGLIQYYIRLDDPFWQSVVHLMQSWIDETERPAPSRSERTP
jgi:DNA-binding transcriptional ArsR family regulator